jgi:hypothetical protein
MQKQPVECLAENQCNTGSHRKKTAHPLQERIIMNDPKTETVATMFNEHQLAERFNMSVRTLQN